MISKITIMISEGYLSDAKTVLENITDYDDLSADKIVENYDAIYLMLIQAYLRQNDLVSAEKIAAIFQSKINSDSYWCKTSCYSTLTKAFKDKVTEMISKYNTNSAMTILEYLASSECFTASSFASEFDAIYDKSIQRFISCYH